MTIGGSTHCSTAAATRSHQQQQTQQKRQQKQQRGSRLDPVVPTAVAALHARRQSQQTLREIDALLASDDAGVATTASSTSHRHSQQTKTTSMCNTVENTTPGPGAYSPHNERTQWTRSAAVALKRSATPHNKKTAVIRCEQARAINRTPGPGAYDTQSADRVIKPRIRSSGFLPDHSTSTTTTTTTTPLDLEPARAYKWLSQYKHPIGAVAYKQPLATTSGTRDQRATLRRIRLAKTRHTRIGFYSVRHTLTERRLGARGVLAMAMSMAKRTSKSSTATRRKFRAWQPAMAAPLEKTKTPPGTTPTVKTSTRSAAARTIQWQRARTRTLLLRKQLPLHHSDPQRRTASPILVAHDMARHTGRDAVKCHYKNRRVVGKFSAAPVKQATQSTTTTEIRSRGGGGHVPFATIQGRNECTVDATTGVYLLGRDQELLAWQQRTSGLDATPRDDFVRKRVQSAVIRGEPQQPRRLQLHDNHQPLTRLSPKYELVEKRAARGHVAFASQLDRHERARDKTFRVENTELFAAPHQELLTPRTLHVRDAIKFPRKDAGVLAFRKATCRKW